MSFIKLIPKLLYIPLVLFYLWTMINSYATAQETRSDPTLRLFFRPLEIADNLFLPFSDYIATQNTFSNISDTIQERAFGFLRNTTQRLYEVATAQGILESELKDALKNPTTRAEIVKQIISIVGSAVKLPKETKIGSSTQYKTTVTTKGTTTISTSTTSTTITSTSINSTTTNLSSSRLAAYRSPSQLVEFPRYRKIIAYENFPDVSYYQLDPGPTITQMLLTSEATAFQPNFYGLNERNPLNNYSKLLYSSFPENPVNSAPMDSDAIHSTTLQGTTKATQPFSLPGISSSAPTTNESMQYRKKIDNGLMKKKSYERPQLRLTSVIPLPASRNTITQALELLSVNIANMFTKAPSAADTIKHSQYINEMISQHYPYTPHIFASMALNLLSFVNQTNELDAPPPSVFYPQKLALLLFFRDSETPEAYATIASDYIRIASSLFTYKRLRKFLLKPQLSEGLPKGVPLLHGTYPSFSSLRETVEKLVKEDHKTLPFLHNKTAERLRSFKKNNEMEAVEHHYDILKDIYPIDDAILLSILQLCEYYEAKGADVYFTWIVDSENLEASTYPFEREKEVDFKSNISITSTTESPSPSFTKKSHADESS